MNVSIYLKSWSQLLGEEIFDQRLGSMPIEKYDEFELLLICSSNYNIGSPQLWDIHRADLPAILLAERSFIPVYGQVHVRSPNGRQTMSSVCYSIKLIAWVYSTWMTRAPDRPLPPLPRDLKQSWNMSCKFRDDLWSARLVSQPYAFLDLNYCFRSVATKIPHDFGLI